MTREFAIDDAEVQWILSSVKFGLGTDALRTDVSDPEAARGAKERLCNEDGALFIINKIFAAEPGSACFFAKSAGPFDRVTFTMVNHDDDKAAVQLPPVPYAFLIKTCDAKDGKERAGDKEGINVHGAVRKGRA